MDALATLAFKLKISEETGLRPTNVETRYEPAYCDNVETEPDENPWFHDIKVFLKDGNTLIQQFDG